MAGYTYDKLRGRIIEKFGSQISDVSVSKKMNGWVQFDQEDILKWSDALDIPITEAGIYFFA